MADDERRPYYNRVVSLLVSRAAQQIDFTLGQIHVDGPGFTSVAHALLRGPDDLEDFPGGVGIEIDEPRSGAGAEYNYNSNLIKLRRASYGITDFERMVIIHECVHAMQDIKAAYVNGPEKPTDSEEEAAAYVAGALFHLYETTTPNPLPANAHLIFVEAETVAKSIKNVSNAAVSDQNAMNLRNLIVAHPVYRDHGEGMKLSTPSRCNGLHFYPMAGMM